MTWYFNPSNTTMDVYDHTGALVAQDREFGGAWSGDFPDKVLEVMDETAVEEFQANGITIYALQCLRHGAFELIEEGTP